MKLKFVKEHSSAVIPQYATEGSSGFDFVSIVDKVILPGKTEVISTGLRSEIPVGKEIQIRSRSGLAAKHSIVVANSPGTVDSDYKGIIKIILHNHGTKPYSVVEGDRIAQGVFANVEQAEIVEGTPEDLTSSIRGEGGLGSTGV